MKNFVLRIISLLLAVLMLVSMAGCTEHIKKKDLRDWQNLGGMYGSENLLQYPQPTLDADTLYKSVEYRTEMFYGRRSIEQGKAGEQSVCEKSEYQEVYFASETNGENVTKTLSVLPVEVYAGRWNMSYGVGIALEKYAPDYPWMQMRFLEKYSSGYFTWDVFGVYEVENNDTLVFTPVVDVNLDQDAEKVTFRFSEAPLRFDFSFCGSQLLLAVDGQYVTLVPSSLVPGHSGAAEEYVRLEAQGIIEAGFSMIDDCVYKISIETSNDAKENTSGLCLYDSNLSPLSSCAGRIDKNGILTICYEREDGTIHSSQYLYFNLGDLGLILFDGAKYYYYTRTAGRSIFTVVAHEDESKLETLPEDKAQSLEEETTSLFSDLEKAMQEEALPAEIRAEAGEVALDYTVLFDVDSAEISEEGKSVIARFWQTYANVVSDPAYDGFVSKILVEGHADPSGGYSYNLPLSQARAEAVAEECRKVSEVGALNELLEPVGYSCSKPVYDEDGNVDYDASRRVAFRFIINLE